MDDDVGRAEMMRLLEQVFFFLILNKGTKYDRSHCFICFENNFVALIHHIVVYI